MVGCPTRYCSASRKSCPNHRQTAESSMDQQRPAMEGHPIKTATSATRNQVIGLPFLLQQCGTSVLNWNWRMQPGVRARRSKRSKHRVPALFSCTEMLGLAVFRRRCTADPASFVHLGWAHACHSLSTELLSGQHHAPSASFAVGSEHCRANSAVESSSLRHGDRQWRACKRALGSRVISSDAS